MEQFHTLGSLENILSYGDQLIPEQLDEVFDVESIVYEKKRQSIVIRTQRKNKIIVDSAMLCTSEEIMFGTKRDELSELLGVWVAISHATIDRDEVEEREVEEIKKELETIRD